SNSGDVYVVKSYYKNPNNANELVATDTVNVFRSGVNLTASTTPAACAAANTGTITITSPIGFPNEYSIDGINWQTLNNFTVTAGTYTVRTRISNTACVTSKNFTVINNKLSANFDVVPTQCSGPPSGSITIFPQNGNPPYAYSINGGTFQSSNVFSNLASGNYTVLVTDVASCSFSKLVIVGTQAPAFTVTTVDPDCSKGQSGSITVYATGSPPYTYSINTNPPQTSNIFNNLSNGTHTVIVKDATGCFSALSVILNSDTLSKVITDIKMPTCFGDGDGSVIIHPSGNPQSYQYSLGENAYQAGNVFNNLASGNYTFHVKNATGCVFDTIVTVLQPNKFLISNITTNATTCISPDGQITIKANGGTTPYYYSVDNGKTFSLTNTFTVKSGRYSVVVKDNHGCITQESATVDATTNNMKLELGADKSVCYGDSIPLVPTSNVPPDYYSWSPDSFISDTSSGVPIVVPKDTITYFLTARSGNCQQSDSIKISVLHKPQVNAGRDTVICYNTKANLEGVATNLSGPIRYQWLPSLEIDNPLSPVTFVRPKNSGANVYRLQVRDMYGCNFKVYDDVTVIMNAPVIANAGNDTVATIGVPHQLTSSSGGVEYTWTPSFVLNNPKLQNPIAVLQNDVKFELVVKDSIGCVSSDDVLIKVYKGSTFYLPNAFTPNGDGLNDVFRATAPGIQATYYFRIFNRWGKLVYETRDARKGWDGTYLGEPQPSAVYVWIIKGLNVKQNIVELKGTVTLLR
ncbi:MAG TPA: gliding motility-associated C-terminal domain-containing protein, partial [Chitinophagaceae bacterium]|nr:gliding motility-associated C-terminal domain-containing protein [Chitinophagaceae bacterium]